MNIVTEYFAIWSSIILPTIKNTHKRFAYIDFFSGPGIYEDGTKSTPILILESAINHQEKCKMFYSVFNDEKKKYIEQLKENIEQLEGYKKLNYKPKYHNIRMDSNLKMVQELKLEDDLIPTLFFIDPFGFKGLYLRLIHTVLKDWGSDGIFFFNYQRINGALSNPPMRTHMEYLFGKSRLEQLIDQIKGKTPLQRESLILQYLLDALKYIGSKFVLDFRFPKYGQDKTSHYLIFVSKNIKGYKVMKEILAKHSNYYTQGVASFEFDPSISNTETYLLPGFIGPLDKLESMLIDHFKGRELSRSEIYEEHDQGDSSTKHYTEDNYKKALLNLENKGKIKIDPPASKRRELTLGGDRIIKFLN
ncbi:MAG: three-Cys-motif partner protein TcmP [Candidatus Dadabacteria bacterium]|nr:three-Cys-motif partner protein TcmP [Candidatus Dadabacteria bacterium]